MEKQLAGLYQPTEGRSSALLGLMLGSSRRWISSVLFNLGPVRNRNFPLKKSGRQANSLRDHISHPIRPASIQAKFSECLDLMGLERPRRTLSMSELNWDMEPCRNAPWDPQLWKSAIDGLSRKSPAHHSEDERYGGGPPWGQSQSAALPKAIVFG